MKKVYNSPQAKESKTKLVYIFCGNSLATDVGTPDSYSKDISNVESEGRDDDFWSTSK